MRELPHPTIPTMKAVIRTYRRSHGYTAFITLWLDGEPIDEYKCGPVLKRDAAWVIGEDFARQILRGWC